MHVRSATVAAHLADLDIRPGDPVGVIGGISIDWCIAAIGVLRAGGILVPLNTRCAARELGAMIEGAGVRLVIADAGYFTHLEAALAGRPVTRVKMEEVCAAGETLEAPLIDIEIDDTAVLFFTNGSTGVPKAAEFTHRGLLGALQEHNLLEPSYRPGCRILNVSQFGFTAGVLHGLLAPAVFGGTSIQLPTWEPSAGLHLIESRRIEIFAAPTIFFEQMVMDPRFATTDLSSLTAVFTGASPVTGSLLAAWHERGVALHQHYGLTESGSTMTSLPLELALKYPDSAGFGGILTKMRTIREDGAACDPGEAGEILIQGPGLAKGYWRAPELTAEVFRHGWLHSGDIGVIDHMGLLRIVGRKKDMIRSGGMNIYAAEIERVIGEMDGILEVAVIGVPDPKWSETPLAIIRSVHALDAATVRAHCREHMAGYKLPSYIEFTEEPLPRSMGNKIVKGPLREQYVRLVVGGRLAKV
jgi:fatty-acyl-CoA synthase